jgi:UDP-N-acetylglucosamine--N-acetylmuramyl-(pentapeptide) pyrophosphoryl-undecaprenol N-acetylglucosamine transferase
VRIAWIGSRAPLDRRIVEESRLADAFYAIPAGKLRRYFSLKTIADAFRILGGFFAALGILAKEKPALLFSKGGYVSVPPCFAAKILKISLFAHECDFSPGLATRLTARLAAALFVSYGETARFFPPSLQQRITVSGNPVRPAIYEGSAEKGRAFLGLGEAAHKPLLLALGGSLGARELNALVEANLEWLCERFIVVHQTGPHADFPVESAPPEYHRAEFFHGEMPDVLAAADLVLSRAGASALWEGAAAGKAMVLLPLSTAGSRGDQIENARFFASRGAALVANSATLRDCLTQALVPAFRVSLGNAAREIAGARRPTALIAGILAQSLATGGSV